MSQRDFVNYGKSFESQRNFEVSKELRSFSSLESLSSLKSLSSLERSEISERPEKLEKSQRDFAEKNLKFVQKMGIKTTAFGPPTWIVLEGLAEMYDKCMTLEMPDKILLKKHIREFFYLFGFVLPCIYCRISYQMFTNPETCDADVSIDRMLLLKDGAKRLVYNLHNCVNKKLRQQELEKVWRSTDKKQIEKRWDTYIPTYEEAVKKRFVSIKTKQFWIAMIQFMAYVMCDYRAEDCQHIYRMFILLGEILNLIPNQAIAELNRSYIVSLKKTAHLWEPHMDISTRFDIVWSIKKHIFTTCNWSSPFQRQQFERECRKHIVGC